MPTISAAAGMPPIGTPLTGITPPPAAASPMPGVPLAGILPPVGMPLPPPEGQAETPAADDRDAVLEESDPQQLLALLLAASPAPPAEQLQPAIPFAASPQPGTGTLAAAGQAGSGDGMQYRLPVAGSPLTGQPVRHVAPPGPAREGSLPLPAAALRGHSAMQPAIVQPAVAPSSVVSEGSEPGFPAEVALQNVPKKLVTPGDALLVSQSVKQMLRADREPSAADITLLHPAPALVNALLKSEAGSGKLPTITLPVAPEQQAEALRKALSERLEMQIDRRVQKATIRLDPPNLGKMDISIHFESGKLQVQIQAAQPEVTRLLQQVSHEMRASLSEQNNVQVNVQVSTQSGDSRQQHRHRDRPDSAIANNNEEVTPQQRGTDGTILTMV
ncbi:flagellar hook-length control protein FliK [Erwinia sp. SLM-02]|uniref:flagellar hook-length control protein FliK n=1 Tax=Erwinia sp. SLM-02 TaxID=3020057 RepID=UPI003080273B